MSVPFALLKQHRVHRHPILHKFLLLLVCFVFGTSAIQVSHMWPSYFVQVYFWVLFNWFFFLDHTFLFSCRFYLLQPGILAILNILATVFSSFNALFCDIIPKHFSYMVPVMWEKYTMPFPLYVNPVHENTTVVTPLLPSLANSYFCIFSIHYNLAKT